jgi:hypothetical protein
MMKEKKQHLDNSIIDPQTGKELFKPQINNNENYKFSERPSSQQKISSSLYDRHRQILEKKKKAMADEIAQLDLNRRNGSKANKFSE